jgi:hypothetical protein
MTVEDVTATLDLALKASGLDQATVVDRPRLLSDNVLCREAGLRLGHTTSFADERQRHDDRPSGFRRQWMALSTIANTRSASCAAFTVLNTRCGSERKA